MQNNEVVKDKIMLQLCKKISDSEDKAEQVQEIANFIEINKDIIDLNYYCSKTKEWAPLHYAAKLGKENIISMLIQKGANPFLAVGTIDPKSQLRSTWITSISLAPETLRKKMKSLFTETLQQNKEYNSSNKLVGSGNELLLLFIASTFGADASYLKLLGQTCSSAKLILDEHLLELKKIYALKKEKSNIDAQLKYSASHIYDPYEDEGIPHPKGGRVANQDYYQREEQNYHNGIAAAQERYNLLNDEIPRLEEELVVKMRSFNKP